MERTNELIHETSPYLLEHAHNPVDWQPWGQKAFEKARRLNLPVFVSIGYSACHWCHVMARESFEDEVVADYLNRHFVCVKVDREERPDVDGIYMRFCQVMTGGGGWPTSVFTDADGKPFFAGTYYPKDVFLNLLAAIINAWENDRSALVKNGERIIFAFNAKAEKSGGGDNIPFDKAVKEFKRDFDSVYGGFGAAPKFPAPHNLMFLLSKAPDMAEKTLEQMYRGGIFDHVGGGFSRYSTDRFWLIPHFEKMLYDNALAATAYLLAYEKTQKSIYKQIAEKIFMYLKREMRADGGGYYSSQDADSERTEGKFYVFTPNEIKSVLGETEGLAFCARYGITEEGNFNGASVPNLLNADENDKDFSGATEKIYDYRLKRVPPHIDKKILTAWNSLVLTAYAFGARITKNAEYLAEAENLRGFIERKLTDGEKIYSGITDGKIIGNGFLDDYAYFVFALLQLHQATMEKKYLIKAEKLALKTWENFGDKKIGGFFFSGEDNEKLVLRPKETFDGALPSGNSVMAYNLSRLYLLTEKEFFGELSRKQNVFMNGEAAEYPSQFGFYLFSRLPVKKVVCVPRAPESLIIRSDWVFSIGGAEKYPLLNGRTTFYVCENGVCRPPSNETIF